MSEMRDRHSMVPNLPELTEAVLQRVKEKGNTELRQTLMQWQAGVADAVEARGQDKALEYLAAIPVIGDMFHFAPIEREKIPEDLKRLNEVVATEWRAKYLRWLSPTTAVLDAPSGQLRAYDKAIEIMQRWQAGQI